jgi:glucose/arabinose dehydrogenase
MNYTRSILRRRLAPLLCGVSILLLTACGGGDDPVTPPSSNQAPTLTLASPVTGTTYRAGDEISVSATATDREDGNLPASRLTWWIDLHHDTHSHPAQPVTNGGSGTFETPVRTETSANVWYRVHVRAVDSGGRATEVTRDVHPQTAEVTLATQPTGLQLNLDGQPVTAPHTFTGVQGVERDLGAATQVAGGRRYTFAGWSDGGSATHTIGTPTANTTYTATFTDAGPADNTPPTVTLNSAANGVVGTPVALSATAADSDGSVARVQFFDGGTLLGEDTSTPFEWSWTPTTAGVHTLTARATDNSGDSSTSTAISVTVIDNTSTDSQPPTVSLTAPVNLAAAVSGTVTVSATAADNVGVSAVEFQVDGIALGSADTAAPYEASWNSAALPPGQHIVRARARDAAGNFSPWASATVQVVSSAEVPQGFTKQDDWISGLNNATAFVQAPDGRFFIAEQGGRVRIASAAGQFQALPLINLNVDANGERGLIGITLHPSFPSPAWIYVHYTRPQGNPNNRVARFQYGDLLVGAEDRLIDLPDLSSATNHNGGAIHFGADGKLYIGVGDNAEASHSPDLSTPFGKLLRIDADGSIPSDNPYYNSQSGLARAIWASGLRNPFTFAVEPGTGRIFINDVGAAAWEEINLGAPGANYGWPATEGPTNASGVTAPLFAYRHDAANPPGSGAGGFFLGQSIAGGSFYPTSGSFPAAFRRNYFFADFVANTVGRLDAANGNAAYAFATLRGNPVDMLVGVDGALYVLTRQGVTRIAPTP